MMKSTCKVAVVQDSSVPFDAQATTEKTCILVAEAANNGAELVVFPEAFLGTYPKGLNFDTPVGTRLPEGRHDFMQYFEGAVDIDGKELQQIKECATEYNIFVVLGVIERGGSTLYCSIAFIDPKLGLVGKRRKLMPTGAERLIWGFGDGSTLDVINSELGKIGGVICWENYMPAIRSAMYAQGVEIYCAPTADDRDTWLSSMQHIAMEGRCYVLSACQYITRGEYGEDYRSILTNNPDDVVMRGASVIVGPLGEIIAGPVLNEKTILYAELERATLIKSKMDFDPVGHYSRSDIFSLNVDKRQKKPVHY
ncbi:carbon-nitrogen hydrolase family protein [Psychromonas sp. 14N.309.X.WAT.B.A12]|uniref:carbon-nitrogen hydrolase family protein n=1 Tax=unclassified Psychromonas TaxID=2614957 RepID=UPI0025B18399|nr:carbon-nitrogen hydrolase family protein [Psychromonas sp. 14N.309.X.WAT.B.A12]MDN2663610.1 carbon-nitrogen hydrolase family protein [Psychromonas sp. 14N.309.X.WAT.B.A12]